MRVGLFERLVWMLKLELAVLWLGLRAGLLPITITITRPRSLALQVPR